MSSRGVKTCRQENADRNVGNEMISDTFQENCPKLRMRLFRRGTAGGFKRAGDFLGKLEVSLGFSFAGGIDPQSGSGGKRANAFVECVGLRYVPP